MLLFTVTEYIVQYKIIFQFTKKEKKKKKKEKEKKREVYPIFNYST